MYGPMLDLTVFPAISWPRLLRVRQRLAGPEAIEDVEAAVEQAIVPVADRIRPGATYALGVGSRGIARLPEIVRATIAAVRRRGADVFIVPAMGSHGAATAEGQVDVLASLGVTEASMGVPIRADMAVERVGEVEPGLDAWVAREALRADGIIPVARVKPHTSFRGRVESGVMKMITIGFGKQRGASAVHARGFARFAELVPKVARTVLQHVYMPFALAVVENAHDRPAKFAALVPEGLEDAEAKLLELARAWMGRLPFEEFDVLVVGEVGKNISGTGADPNVTGRYTTGIAGKPVIQKVVFLHLTEDTHGNATGLGTADIITRDLFDHLDFAKTYMNAVTSTNLGAAKIPVIMNSDRDAVELALRTLNGVRPEDARLVAIRNTLEVEEFVISEALWPEAERLGLKALTTPHAPTFGPDGSFREVSGLSLYGSRG
jgi:hypothetical protein